MASLTPLEKTPSRLARVTAVRLGRYRVHLANRQRVAWTCNIRKSIRLPGVVNAGVTYGGGRYREANGGADTRIGGGGWNNIDIIEHQMTGPDLVEGAVKFAMAQKHVVGASTIS